jgi:hypothetical protein
LAWHDHGIVQRREDASMKRFIFAAVVALFVITAAAPVFAQESQSAAPAATVKALFDQLKITAIAGKDPDEAGRYIAALYVQDTELLVISAPFAVPAAMDKFIADGNYMDAYQSLQAVVNHKGHFFVVDMQNDGLKRVNAGDEAFDSTTTDGGATLQFDGKWDAQKVTEAAYNEKFAKDDARYAKILKALATELRKKTTEF